MAWFDKKPWPYSVHSVWLSCVVLIKHDSSLALLPAGALFTASAGRWMRLHALWPTCVLVIMWHQSSVLSTGFRSVSAYNTNCVFWCMVLLTGMRPTTSAIWPHWHSTSGRSHLRSADSLTFDILRTRTRMGDRALSVAGPRDHVRGTHFRLTFAVYLVWTLLRSISKHICFLLPTIQNNCFNFLNTRFYSLFYAPGTYILVCCADHDGLV